MDSQESFAALNKAHGIPGAVSIVAGNGGLAKVAVSTPHANGEMYLHGGHVTSWQPDEADEVLYLSPNSLWQDGKAIRGGVPICFPWFGDKAGNASAPAHGFVRTREWNLESTALEGGEAVITMETASDENSRKWWAQDFRLQCRVRFGKELKIDLLVSNQGRSSFSFEEALHAYFRVGDVEMVTLQGLDATNFLDKTEGRTQKTNYGGLHLTGETDRIFLDTRKGIDLEDSSMHRFLKIEKQNSTTTVIWNPWKQKSAEMGDLGRDEWRKFVCVEASNVIPNPVTLEAGRTHTMSVVVSARTR